LGKAVSQAVARVEDMKVVTIAAKEARVRDEVGRNWGRTMVWERHRAARQRLHGSGRGTTRMTEA